MDARAEGVQVTGREFAAWLEVRGLSHKDAVPLFAAKHSSEINRWARGKRGVPDRVAMIAELREEIEALRSEPRL